MAMFYHLTPQQINNYFTHNALAYGIYPIYVSHDFSLRDKSIMVAVRNGWPEWGLTLLHSIYHFYCRLRKKKIVFRYLLQKPIKFQAII